MNKIRSANTWSHYFLLLCIATASVYPLPMPQKTNDDTENGKAIVGDLTHKDNSTGVGKLFEGDILLEKGEKPYGYRKRREDVAVSGSGPELPTSEVNSFIWPNKTIYYTFSQTLPDNFRDTFIEAMNEWSEHTCLQFEASADDSKDHLYFVKDEFLGCSSFVGRKGGAQIISLSSACSGVGHAIHEIGHAIGLWHEHSRPDRDEFIEVLYENIHEGEEENFGVLADAMFRLVPDVGYDIESIMHYGPYAFSRETSGPDKRTIRLRENAPLAYKSCLNLLTMGQRDKLSYLDKLRANKLYSCNAELTLLEEEGRKCVLPPTTPSPTQPSPMPVPTPTTTVQTTPTPSPPTPSQPIRLKSGSYISLFPAAESGDYEKGLICRTNCVAERCITIGQFFSCNRRSHQFEIVDLDNPVAKKIRSGAKVGFRSRTNPSQWLDCSVQNKACSVSRCTRNDADIGTNVSNFSITSCDAHQFTILGVGRREGRLLNTNHSIQLKYESNDSFLSCNVSDKCKMDSHEAAFNFRVLG